MKPVLKPNIMVSQDEVDLVIGELDRVLRLGLPGDVVEFGCNVGNTSVFLQDALQRNGSQKKLVCIDSFQGFPETESIDEDCFKKGGLAVQQAELLGHFDEFQLPHPVVVQSWIEELRAKDLPDEICFAFVDCDIYKPAKWAFGLAWIRMPVGGSVVFHDIWAKGIQRAIWEGRQGMSREEIACCHRSYIVRKVDSVPVVGKIGGDNAALQEGVRQ
jgi:O-methyltransferase